MLTLTRKVGQRTFIGAIEIEVVDVGMGGVVLRLSGVEDESTIKLVDASGEEPSPRPRPATRRRRVMPSSRQSEPVIIEKRRTRRTRSATGPALIIGCEKRGSQRRGECLKFCV